jgi:HSP20 family protein
LHLRDIGGRKYGNNAFDPFRGDPFREISLLQREMNRLFDRMTTTSDGETEIAGSSLYQQQKFTKLPKRLNSE